MTERGRRPAPVCSPLRGGDTRGFGLLAGPGVLVEGALLHGLVDLRNQIALLGLDRAPVSGLDGTLEAAEMGLHRAGEHPVLRALALPAHGPLFFDGIVGTYH